MKIVIIEDDVHIIKILQKIIEDRNLGEVVGYSMDGIKGLEGIKALRPDIVLVDLLMPGKDGLYLVKEAKKIYPRTKFIMISQVSCKDMIGRAYENGIEYYIYKPINAIEIESVMKKVIDLLKMDHTSTDFGNVLRTNEMDHSTQGEEYENKIIYIMKRIGIIGQVGTKDIIKVVKYLLMNNKSMSDYTIKELFSYFTDNPKSMEQRIRRTAYAGMINICNIGIEDSTTDIFVEYSNSIYDFRQVKKQMDHIRGKDVSKSAVNVKKFIDGIVFHCIDNNNI